MKFGISHFYTLDTFSYFHRKEMRLYFARLSAAALYRHLRLYEFSEMQN